MILESIKSEQYTFKVLRDIFDMLLFHVCRIILIEEKNLIRWVLKRKRKQKNIIKKR